MFNATATTEIYPYGHTLCLHDALPICWIDAAQDAWAIYDDVKAMPAASPIAEAEEWSIHDYEGFGNVRISEYAGFAYVSELAAFIAEHGELEIGRAHV